MVPFMMSQTSHQSLVACCSLLVSLKVLLRLQSVCFLIQHHILFCLLIYLFLAALGLCCRSQAFSSCSERELLFVAVHGLLIAVASLVAEHGL